MSDSEPTELPSSPPEPVFNHRSLQHHSSAGLDGSQLASAYGTEEPLSITPPDPPSPQDTQDLDSNVSDERSGSSPRSAWASGPEQPRSITPQRYYQYLRNNMSQDTTEFSPGLPSAALPPPFSASTRMVSFDASLLSSSSPASQYYSAPSTPLDRHQTSDNHLSPARRPRPHRTHMPHQPSSPRRYVSSLSPPTATTPHRRIRVYDDRLPPYSQPQTPAHFERHRRVDAAAFTAPARYGRSRHVTPSPRPRRNRRSGTRTLSSRVEPRELESPRLLSGFGWGFWADAEIDQENTSVEEELVRRMETLRRRRNVGVGEVEWEREAGEGRLDRTPPREERIGWEGF